MTICSDGWECKATWRAVAWREDVGYAFVGGESGVALLGGGGIECHAAPKRTLARGAVWCGVVRCGVTARDVEMMDGVVRRGEERDDGGCESVCVT